MNIENFIQDYLVIPNRFNNGFGMNLDFAKIDPIAARAKYEYSIELSFLIRRFIWQEDLDSTTLKYLIDKYDKKLAFNFTLVFTLYKKYLLVEFMDENYYKRLLEFIPQHWDSDWVAKARLMQNYVYNKNFEAAREVLMGLGD